MRLPVRLLLLLLLAAAAPASAGDRYLGRLASGQWIRGEQLSDWHRRDAAPKLDGRPLLDEADPIRWLLDQSLPLPAVPDSYVETVTGDRLPGEVLAHRQGDETPYQQLAPHFLVKTTSVASPSPREQATTIRVVERHVQRIVWRRRRVDRWQPGTLFLRDGGEVAFRAARFAGSSVTLLVAGGTQTVEFSQIDELHLGTQDSWDAVFDELCLLSPGGQSRLLQVETISGLIATASLDRFDARVRGDARDAGRWLHGLQPAWSLDMLWLRNADLRLRRSFAPHEIPLTRIRPAQIDPRAGPAVWPARVNQNALGQPLRSGVRTFGWGFAVHAASQLRFVLPGEAAEVQTWVGLDHVVGPGGCARASVWLDESAGHPLYESPLLVGSGEVAASGRVAVPETVAAPRQLILGVDAVGEQQPAGADPGGVRDLVVWGDPLITLDQDGLRAQLALRTAEQIAAWRGWQLRWQGELEGLNWWSGSAGAFQFGVAARHAPLELSRRATLAADEQWLVVQAAAVQPNRRPPRLRVLLDGRLLDEQPLDATAGTLEPLVVPLSAPGSQSHEIQVLQLPDPDSGPVLWKGISLSRQHPSWLRVLEDELPAGAGEESADCFSGRRSLRVAAGQTISLPLPGPTRIRGSAGPGEHRFLRFAMRQQGQASLQIGLRSAAAPEQPWVFWAGPGARAAPRVKPVWSDALPDRWLVITRDVYGDFGEAELEAITLSVSGQGSVLLDHIYLARRQGDFELVSDVVSSREVPQ